MMGPYMNYGYGFGGFFGGIFMIIIWILIILAIVWMIKSLFEKNDSQNQIKGKSALDILKERYARGEISKVEFDKIKKDIK